MAYVIIGSKPYTKIELNDILDVFPENARCNLAIPNNNNGTKACDYILNGHIALNMNRYEKEKCYSCYSQQVEKDYFYKAWDFFKSGSCRQIYVQRKGMVVGLFNKYLREIGSPVYFSKNPRVGYEMIYNLLISGKRNIFVSGFSLDNKINVSFYNDSSVVTDTKIAVHHNILSEIRVLKWLHSTNRIDITLCSLKDNPLPTFNCKEVRPTIQILGLFLQKYGICILENYFSEETIMNINNNFNEIFKNQKDLIDILDKEGCSNDERIFHAEKYGEHIRRFSEEPLFNEIAKRYNSNFKKKTLINRLTYEEGKIKNSGAGWHRDNHHCQFKAIMYLTDVNNKNGNFQFLTNSSRRHIGYPKPRTADYNTRFSDETIEEILKNKTIEKHDLTGKKGTVLLVDTTYIHRGNIIEEGERKAITQYYF